jgi:hypothetical protein
MLPHVRPVNCKALVGRRSPGARDRPPKGHRHPQSTFLRSPSHGKIGQTKGEMRMDGWAYYDGNGRRVRPNWPDAVAMGKEVLGDAHILAPANRARSPRLHYVDVHAIGSADRQNFTSTAKFKAWCRAQRRDKQPG